MDVAVFVVDFVTRMYFPDCQFPEPLLCMQHGHLDTCSWLLQ
jgi:hypothetical protein